MIRIIKCKCGEESTVGGRCVGCKRVRPSSKEVLSELLDLSARQSSALTKLKIALDLESK